ncbi:MAG: alpha/beta hydrolase [Bacteroidota bacterium]
MKKTIVFVHGMFQTNKSWEKWVNFFNEKGFHCMAPAWPLHEGEPSALRNNPPADLGDLRLNDVVAHIEQLVTGLPERPIVIGHSVGGLIVQLLANKDLISLGVPINSVAPNAMLSFDWDFFKNSVKIANPFKGDEPFEMNAEGFHDAFANTLSKEEAAAEFEKSAVHDSRNVLRDCMMEYGHVDLEKQHAPLLFISGHEDHIIPYELVEKNSKAYDENSGISDYKDFEGRSHYICAEPGWEEVATHVYNWIQSQSNNM